MKVIKCNCGRDILVDDQDYEQFRNRQWNCCGNSKIVGYTIGGWGQKSYFISMASLLLGVPEGYQIDHRDLNSHNNQRENLRPATVTQQCQNRRKHFNVVSGFKGVYPVKHGLSISSWKAIITVNKKMVYLGTFPTKFEAAMAYNTAAMTNFGEFAALNDITKLPQFVGPTLP